MHGPPIRSPIPVAAAHLALVVLLATTIGAPAGISRHHHRRHHAEAPIRPGAAAADQGPDCRYPDGTPFDPDVIGGPNHVGDGGPAVNLGGYPPCGY